MYLIIKEYPLQRLKKKDKFHTNHATASLLMFENETSDSKICPEAAQTSPKATSLKHHLKIDK